MTYDGLHLTVRLIFVDTRHWHLRIFFLNVNLWMAEQWFLTLEAAVCLFADTLMACWRWIYLRKHLNLARHRPVC